MDGRDGTISIRIMGEKPDDIRLVASVIENYFKGWCVASPIFPNTRDPGYRCYVTIKIGRKGGGVEKAKT